MIWILLNRISRLPRLTIFWYISISYSCKFCYNDIMYPCKHYCDVMKTVKRDGTTCWNQYAFPPPGNNWLRTVQVLQSWKKRTIARMRYWLLSTSVPRLKHLLRWCIERKVTSVDMWFKFLYRFTALTYRKIMSHPNVWNFSVDILGLGGR